VLVQAERTAQQCNIGCYGLEVPVSNSARRLRNLLTGWRTPHHLGPPIELSALDDSWHWISVPVFDQLASGRAG
jgi:hypothetical protein